MNSETIPWRENQFGKGGTQLRSPTWDVNDLQFGAHSSHIWALRQGVCHHNLEEEMSPSYNQQKVLFPGDSLTSDLTVGPSQDCLPPARWVSRCQRRCRGWRAHKLSFTTAQLEVHTSKAPFGKTKWVQTQKRQRIFKKSRAITQPRAVEAPPGQVLWLTQCQPVNRQLKWYRLPSKNNFKSIWRGMKSLMNPLVKDPYTC